MAAQIFVLGAGYAFLAFSIGWWVGYYSARREKNELRVEDRAAGIDTYRTIESFDDLRRERPNHGKTRTG